MIFIDPEESEKRIPPGWRERARAAAQELATADGVERTNVLKKHGHLWRELNSCLLEASHGKCWYCETRSDRAACDVDHFRPKSRVHGCNHPGYWWLAFSSENYRISCQYCNRVGSEATRSEPGGKGDNFPLVDEARRATSPDDDLSAESPVLLDPTSPLDVQLLWFDEDGMARPHEVYADDGEARHRAEVSIEILNLNEEDLRQARFVAMQEFRRDYARAMTLYLSGGRADFLEAVQAVARRARRESEYCAAARAALASDDTSDDSLAELILANT